MWIGSISGRGQSVFNMADRNRLGHPSVKQKEGRKRPRRTHACIFWAHPVRGQEAAGGHPSCHRESEGRGSSSHTPVCNSFRIYDSRIFPENENSLSVLMTVFFCFVLVTGCSYSWFRSEMLWRSGRRDVSHQMFRNTEPNGLTPLRKQPNMCKPKRRRLKIKEKENH